MGRFMLLAFFLWGLGLTADAQIYKYTDPNGVLRYTDDLTQVPEAQRPSVEKYQELESPPLDPQPPGKATQKAPPSKPPGDDARGESENQKPETGTPPENLKQALDAEYKALMKEKEQIEKETETYSIRYKTRARKAVARKKLKELEEQRVQWEKKFDAYQAQKKALESKE